MTIGDVSTTPEGSDDRPAWVVHDLGAEDEVVNGGRALDLLPNPPWPAVGGIASLAVSTTTAICQEAEIEIVVRTFVADEIESSHGLLESAFDPSWAHIGEALG